MTGIGLKPLLRDPVYDLGFGQNNNQYFLFLILEKRRFYFQNKGDGMGPRKGRSKPQKEKFQLAVAQ